MFDEQATGLQRDLRDLPPGPRLAKVLESVDSDRLSESERIDLIIAWRRQGSHCLAQFYRQIFSHFEHLQVLDVAMDTAAEQAEVEVGTALRLTRRSAHVEFELAYGLSSSPHVWEALDVGLIDLARARVLVEGLEHLDGADADKVLGRLLEAAPRLTTGQLRSLVGRLCVIINPGAAKARFKEALEARRVETERNGDGTAELRGVDLDPVRAEAAYRRLTHEAHKLRRQGDSRSIDQLRADLLLDLLLDDGKHPMGGSPGSVDIRVDLDVLAELSESPGDLAGFGPVIADIARQVVSEQHRNRWTFTVSDPATGLPVHTGTTRRRPHRSLRRRVEAINPTCIFPGCRMPSTRCDLDHRRPWSRDGHTCEDNLAPLCRRHHRIRHLLQWQHRPLPGGDHLWTSPLGRQYTQSGRSP